jgi:hypothetical protein
MFGKKEIELRAWHTLVYDHLKLSVEIYSGGHVRLLWFKAKKPEDTLLPSGTELKKINFEASVCGPAFEGGRRVWVTGWAVLKRFGESWIVDESRPTSRNFAFIVERDITGFLHPDMQARYDATFTYEDSLTPAVLVRATKGNDRPKGSTDQWRTGTHLGNRVVLTDYQHPHF